MVRFFFSDSEIDAAWFDSNYLVYQGTDGMLKVGIGGLNGVGERIFNVNLDANGNENMWFDVYAYFRPTTNLGEIEFQLWDDNDIKGEVTVLLVKEETNKWFDKLNMESNNQLQDMMSDYKNNERR